jgi:glycosyltransferase involved in cell wall biosynthesis
VATSSSSSKLSPIEPKRSIFQEIKNIITDCLSIPDQQIGWFPSAMRKGRRIIQEQHIDVIYATGGPWTSLLIAAFLKQLTGTPLVIDFRDPWLANPSPRLHSKTMRHVEPFLERHVIMAADHIVANTAELRQNFLDRYPHLSHQAVTAIPNGFERYIPLNDQPEGPLTFTHAGALYFSRNPRFLLQAVLHLLETNSIPQEEIRLVLLGGIDGSIDDSELYRILEHPLMRDVVQILPRVPYQEAVRYQLNSHVLFLIQPDFPLQIPRKLYEYIAFQKPILGITNVGGATANIIKENNLGIVVENRSSDVESAIKQFYSQWKNGELTQMPTQACDKFMNRNLTPALREIFEICLNNSRRK